MMDEEHLQKQSLAKERAFLFLSLLLVGMLLSGSSQSLLIFFSGTFNALTGASIALEPVGMKDYFIGLGIFVALVALSFYIVHVLRNPKPQTWHPEFPAEEKEPLTPLKEDHALEQKLDSLNQEILELRMKKEPTDRRILKKLTRFANVREDMLRGELSAITARLQGFRKPTVLEAPQEKTAWDKDLEKVKKELEHVHKMKLKKVKIREIAPSMTEIVEMAERKRLGRELKKVSSMLEKGRKDSSYFIRKYIPSLREWELAQINKKLRQKGSLPVKELGEIERKLMMLKRKG